MILSCDTLLVSIIHSPYILIFARKFTTLFHNYQGIMRNSLFFRLPCPPLAKRGSLTHSQALALSKRARDVTAPPVALNRCALRLAGHQSPRQFFVRDGTALLKAGHQRSRQVVRDGTALI